MKRKLWPWMISFMVVFVVLFNKSSIKIGRAEEDYDLIAFMNECQKMSGDPGIIAIVQWIPNEWWQLTLKRAGVPEVRIREVLELFEPYSSFIVIHGRITSSGLPSFTSESIIRQHLYLKDKAGELVKPMDDENISAGVRNAIIMIKPIFSNMLGRMGDNMNFFFFSSKDNQGKKSFSATQVGKFAIHLQGIPEAKDQVFEWDLPLESLIPSIMCLNCNRKAKGSWKFCPWCGKKLFFGGLKGTRGIDNHPSVIYPLGIIEAANQ